MAQGDRKMTESEVEKKWLWLLHVVFALSITHGFRKLEETLCLPVNLIWDCRIYEAICLYVFFLYYILVYNCLVKEFPYKKSIYCMLRVFIDLALAFLFYRLLITGMKPFDEQLKYRIITLISFWHFFVIIWYFLALTNINREKREYRKFIIPHIKAIAFYWAFFGAGSILSDKVIIMNEEHKAIFLHLVVSTGILVFAISRMHTFVWKMITQDKTSQSQLESS